MDIRRWFEKRVGPNSQNATVDKKELDDMLKALNELPDMKPPIDLTKKGNAYVYSDVYEPLTHTRIFKRKAFMSADILLAKAKDFVKRLAKLARP